MLAEGPELRTLLEERQPGTHRVGHVDVEHVGGEALGEVLLGTAGRIAAREAGVRGAPRRGTRLVADGGILLVQNGIGVEPDFAAAAPGREVLGGLAFLCSRRISPRQIEHLDYGTLTIAAHTAEDAAAGVTPLMRAIAADLGAAGTQAVLDEDLVRARWRKLMWNIAFNPLSVILDATTDELVADPAALDLIRTLMAEVAAAAAAEGRDLPHALIDDLVAATARMAP